ncbi:MAG: phage tail protein [Methylohalobius sp. ZOD2]|nr:phage tail protein [Methylothermaceae bacterium]
MAEPYLGEIKIWGLSFSPRGWAYCDGQLMAIAQNSALYSLLGTQFGGDGHTTFGLPKMQGRAPVHPSSHTDVATAGQMGGQEYVTLSAAQLPSHTHAFNAEDAAANQLSPSNGMPARAEINTYAAAADLVSLNPSSLQTTGGSQDHPNIQPSLVLNFCIALMGVYPPRN